MARYKLTIEDTWNKNVVHEKAADMLFVAGQECTDNDESVPKSFRLIVHDNDGKEQLADFLLMTNLNIPHEFKKHLEEAGISGEKLEMLKFYFSLGTLAGNLAKMSKDTGKDKRKDER